MNDIVVSITPRYGAYLISFDHHDAIVDTATAVELYDCASALAAAKRIAKDGARGAGFTHLRWEPGADRNYPANTLLLTGRPPEEDEGFGY